MVEDNELSRFEKEIRDLEKLKQKIVLKDKQKKNGSVFSEKIASALNELKSFKLQEKKPSEKHLQKAVDLNKKIAGLFFLKEVNKTQEVEPEILSEQEKMLEDLVAQLYLEEPKKVVAQKSPPIFSVLTDLAAKLGLVEKGFVAPEEKRVKSRELLEVRCFNEFGKPLDVSKAVFFFDNKKISPVSMNANTAFFNVSAEEVIFKMPGYANFKGLMPYEGQPLIVHFDSILKIIVVDEQGKKCNDAFLTLTNETGERVSDVNSNSVWKTPFPEDSEPGIAYIPLNQALLSSSLLAWCVKTGYNETRIVIPAELFSGETQVEQTISLTKIIQSTEVNASVTTN